MLNKIPKHRLILYFILLSVCPLFLSITLFFSSSSKVSEIENQIAYLKNLTLLQQQRQASNQAVIAHFKDADHFYIDKHLETIALLENEIESLEKVRANPHYTGDDYIEKRLQFLNGPENRLAFSEGAVQSTPLFQETAETLIHPVELNVENLKKLLFLIEAAPSSSSQPEGRPQLIILDFKIDKKRPSDKNETYFLNLKLLKREYL